MQIQVEKPRLGIPVSLIIDDAVPCINALYYFHKQVSGKDYENHERLIPLAFLDEFIAVIQKHGIRGKFTVLPYPAGLGTLSEPWEGSDWDERQRWLEKVRTVVAQQFDITPEILTHTLALDLSTRQMLPEAEHLWMAKRSQAELAEYMGAAVHLLQEAGFRPNGITQPCFFNGDKAAYSRAVLAALRPAQADPEGTVAFYFSDSFSKEVPPPQPPVTTMDRERGEASVSILDYTDDYFWDGQYPGALQEDEAETRLISADGKSGRIPDLVNSGSWVISTTHWQSQYANGTRRGLRGLDEVANRLERTYGDRLLWVTNSQIARYRAAEESCLFDWNESGRLKIDSGFACPDFTITLMPDQPGWIEKISVQYPAAAQPLSADRSTALLGSNSWRQPGSDPACIQVCLDLQRGVQELIITRGAL
jgi:hypothetical protein